MTENDDRPAGSLFERCVTRREMLITTGGAVAGVLLVGCGGAGGGEEGAQEQQGAPPVAGSFVGGAEEPDPDSFVAVVASGAQEEEEEGGGEREVRAYLCDGQELNEWFWGSAEGNEFELASEAGFRIEGNLAPEASTGTITLSDGASFPFAANLATGIAGLYDVTISDEGQVRGASETGGRLEGRISGEPDEDGLYPLAATLTAPDGEERSIESVSGEQEPGEARWVVLPDGSAKGKRKGVPSGSGGVGFIDPITQE